MESTSEKRLSRRKFAAAVGKALREKVQETHAKGYSNASIAQNLGISESTVRKLLVPPPSKDDQ